MNPDHLHSPQDEVSMPVLTLLPGSTGRHTCKDQYHDLCRMPHPDDFSLSLTAWRDDTASAKIDLLTGDQAISGVTVSCGPLTSAQGEVLHAAVTCSPVGDTLAHDTDHLIPDVICPPGPTDMPAGSVTSVWISVRTPADAIPGVYQGKITVTADGGIRQVCPLSLEVIGLNRPQNTVELELWQYPYSSNRYYSGKSTEAYFGEEIEGVCHTRLDTDGRAGEALRSQVALYAGAGGQSVTVTVVEDPWNSQTPDPYPSMIKWTRRTDGTFDFDYTDYDAWVQLNESCGVRGRILSFSMSDWANRITYRDDATGQTLTETLTPGSDRWRDVWGTFLTDYMAHTTEMGWFDRVYMAMDERPPEVVEAVLDLVESVRNERGLCFRTALAVFTFDAEYLFDRVTDLSLAYYMDPAKLTAITAHRREMGLVTTLYTCGPQLSALENPPYESLYCMWYCEKMGADGFLRWALDAFNQNPLLSSDHRLFAAGDIYLIYPDQKDAAHPLVRTSPRFEMLAEGCRDISKLRYLKHIAPNHAAALEALLSLIGHSDNMEEEVHQARQGLNRIARLVAQEHTGKEKPQA